MLAPSSIRVYTNHYLPDGNGRDTYIKVNEGGLSHCKNQGLSLQILPSYEKWTNLKTNRVGSFQPSTKNYHYKYDGSGRDNYIGFNNGGNSQVFQGKSSLIDFKVNLRKYQETRKKP